MPPCHGKEVSQLNWGHALALHKEEKSYRYIEDKTGVPKSTACDIVANYNKYGSATPRPCSGCPPVLSAQTQCSIGQYLHRYQFNDYKTISKHVGTVTEEEQPVWPKVTQKEGEVDNPKNMVPTFCSGCEGIPLWGCIAHDKKGLLIWLDLLPPTVGKNGHSKGGGLTLEAYVEQVLGGPLIDFLHDLEEEQGHKILIVEDGAPSHRGEAARNAQEQLGIEQFSHPPNSPNLNAIKPIWCLLKSHVLKVHGALRNAIKLWKAAQRVWKEMSMEDINKHMASLNPAQSCSSWFPAGAREESGDVDESDSGFARRVGKIQAIGAAV
ncbi:Transposable element Tc1 transposase [Rhizoctonia solani]|uniref:Transposable element Tc1 transposase n=1 Tax=Rhizoctonia solani TaxID=456999 RepID=A0A8H8NRB2_9AGAM|nr:Transposable element Tc1 transposase [Rhizoctonia solani]QRW16928.1 Transposable element Tc1 transposase [Rhizoctonia solani]